VIPSLNISVVHCFTYVVGFCVSLKLIYIARDQVMRAVSTSGLNKSRVSLGDSMNGQMFIMSGEYRGTPVAIKSLRKTRINEDQKLREEMRIVSNHPIFRI